MVDGGYEDCRRRRVLLGGMVRQTETGDEEDGPRVYLKTGVPGSGLAKGKETRQKKKHLIWVRHQTLRIGTLRGAARRAWFGAAPGFHLYFRRRPLGFLVGNVPGGN